MTHAAITPFVVGMVALLLGRFWGQAVERTETKPQIEALGHALDSANNQLRTHEKALHVAFSVASKVPGLQDRADELQARADSLHLDVGYLTGLVAERDTALTVATSVAGEAGSLRARVVDLEGQVRNALVGIAHLTKALAMTGGLGHFQPATGRIEPRGAVP